MRIAVDSNVLDAWESIISVAGAEHTIEICLDVVLEYLICGERARANLLALHKRLGSQLEIVDLGETLRWEASPVRSERPVFPLDADAVATWDVSALPRIREAQRETERRRHETLIDGLKERDTFAKMDLSDVKAVLDAQWSYVREKLPAGADKRPQEDFRAHLLHIGSVLRIGLGAGRADDKGQETLRDPTTKRNRNNEMDGRIMAAYSYANVVVSNDEYFRRVLGRIVGSLRFTSPVPRAPSDAGIALPQPDSRQVADAPWPV